ncbi:spore coat protein [Aquibacillus koreensis]|uniref:Spore coat protein n=1 Tax=Aquibacillus koreensis TaxID=279446 RepID=A0A9X3WJ29_9BACI|nr:spore coat protein [Aquibacillus koreensis]MCT2536436.1 spore coat protein [Aquibacillus koreensis]MDC3419475.1 spore coat protein [Aquibacillus koreensis]
MINQNQMQGNQQMPQNMVNQAINHNHGAHEILDSHELIGCLIGTLEHYEIYDQNIQDQELKGILQRQKAFMTQMYNTVVESFSTGQDPTVPTQQYKMQQSNEVTYGLKAGQPKKPKQSVSELTDECYSSFMLSQTKAATSTLAMAAAEMNNPVLRRVIADSVPNMIEMSYELFLYQNKNGYYQVPQLKDQDMNIMLQAYTKAPQQGMH